MKIIEEDVKKITREIPEMAKKRQAQNDMSGADMVKRGEDIPSRWTPEQVKEINKMMAKVKAEADAIDKKEQERKKVDEFHKFLLKESEKLSKDFAAKNLVDKTSSIPRGRDIYREAARRASKNSLGNYLRNVNKN